MFSDIKKFYNGDNPAIREKIKVIVKDQRSKGATDDYILRWLEYDAAYAASWLLASNVRENIRRYKESLRVLRIRREQAEKAKQMYAQTGEPDDKLLADAAERAYITELENFNESRSWYRM